jgi:hypothetical protein
MIENNPVLSVLCVVVERVKEGSPSLRNSPVLPLRSLVGDRDYGLKLSGCRCAKSLVMPSVAKRQNPSAEVMPRVGFRPPQLWTTLWATRMWQGESRAKSGPATGCSFFRHKKDVEKQALERM